jgi:hypothetical protein
MDFEEYWNTNIKLLNKDNLKPMLAETWAVTSPLVLLDYMSQTLYWVIIIGALATNVIARFIWE